ncbi:MAG TPA: AraC family transcriptional regulator [Vicinamibacteria bacterium]|nr:AraC family transcriptional regulator [Vicinamibacteria bacterium]
MRLAAGQFYGDVAHRRVVNGLILTETRYGASAAFPRHSHDLPYFSLLVTGAHAEQVARREIGYRPFAAVFHPTGEEHAGEVRAGSRLFVLELDRSWLARVPGPETVPADGRVLQGVAPVELAARVYHEFHLGDRCSDLAIEGLACEMLAAATSERQAPSPRPGWLRRVEDLLHDETDERLGLSRIAAEAGVHPMHLARVFRRHHGTSLGGFVRRRKLETACALLARPGAALADVAAQLGFTDQSHFTRVFKAALGLTPGRFRDAAAGRARRASFVQDRRRGAA